MSNLHLLPIEVFVFWLASGERGISSNAMVSQITGRPVGRRFAGGDHPYDPSDFRRCEQMLRQVPLARLYLSAMRERSPKWAALADAWDELVALLESEVPGIFAGGQRGKAPKTYARMRELLDSAQ